MGFIGYIGSKLKLSKVTKIMSDKWPKVGDFAISNDGSKVTVRCIVRDLAWCECPTSSMQMITIHTCNLKKPRAPEEELRDELVDLAFNQFNDDSYDLNYNAYCLASDLMERYSITKKQ